MAISQALEDCGRFHSIAFLAQSTRRARETYSGFGHELVKTNQQWMHDFLKMKMASWQMISRLIPREVQLLGLAGDFLLLEEALAPGGHGAHNF